jgi:putative zinc finger/helix-turn-helix YgiT family protein
MQMESRVFSRKCGKCRQRDVAIATIPYEIQIDHDGRKYHVSIPALSVPQCGNCGILSIDSEADRQIDAAFRKVAGLLTQEEIREGRKKLGYDQKPFADLLGIAVSTLSRWETGTQIQQRFHDGILRAVFAIPELRSFLADLHGIQSNPLAATAAGETVILNASIQT